MAAIDLAKQVGTTKGDLYVYDGLTLVRLPAGTDAQVLKAASGEAAGLQWADESGGGGGGALTEIETITLEADGTFTFDAIPATYRDLLIVGRLRDDAAATTVSAVRARVGNTSVDTGSNYTSFTAAMRGDSSGNVTTLQSGASSWIVGRACTADSATANRFSPFRMEIIDYADATVRRSFLSEIHDMVSSDGQRLTFASGDWSNTADAIDVVQILGDALGDFKAGSKLTLYGRGSS